MVQEDDMISTAPEVDRLIDANAPIIICVSGGKDSHLVAEQVVSYARNRNHAGDLVLCYSDLGRVVWSDAQLHCEQLAERLGVRLQVVRRNAGGLMERWTKRWQDNLIRYKELSCVKLILPWSTPSMRFCTSELKTAIIQRWIRTTYKRPVLCVLGIRRDESRSKTSGRGSAPTFKVHSTTNGKIPALPEGSIDWNAIVEVKTETVFQILKSSEQPIPSAYQFGSSRFSCCFCIMATSADLFAATRDARNHKLYREQCELEISSTFALQPNKWLSDVAPDLLSGNQRERLAQAKIKAAKREEIESTIPTHLLYVKGWPVAIPTLEEASLIADTRRRVAAVMEIEVDHTTALSVCHRYADLIKLKELKEQTKKHRRKASTTPSLIAQNTPAGFLFVR
jgi:3'-phosphoadenosine 5'-phosphosulfate sulfotransferase (PAPS reductase)/FAD synthetase